MCTLFKQKIEEMKRAQVYEKFVTCLFELSQSIFFFVIPTK